MATRLIELLRSRRIAKAKKAKSPRETIAGAGEAAGTAEADEASV